MTGQTCKLRAKLIDILLHILNVLDFATPLTTLVNPWCDMVELLQGQWWLRVLGLLFKIAPTSRTLVSCDVPKRHVKPTLNVALMPQC